jgi:general stress protein 26
MPEAKTFSEIAKSFDERVRRIVWCTVTTSDTKGRPFSRILHPIWEGSTGWTATGRHTLKTKHLARNPMVAVSYWDPKTTTTPVGYDPGLFFPGGPDAAGYGVLRLTPLRVELWAGQDMLQGRPPTLWRASSS